MLPGHSKPTSHLLNIRLEWNRRSHICWLYALLPSTAEAPRPILGPMLSTKVMLSARMLVSGACLKNLQGRHHELNVTW